VEGEKVKKITNYKIQITNKMAHELHELPRIGTTSNEKFLRGGPGGAVFTKRVPPGMEFNDE
jgi:hypothetical protein